MSHPLKKKDLSTLTPGEKLWMWRRRVGKTQAQAAKTLHLTEKQYRNAENDKHTIDDEPMLIGIRPGDLCALARRRHGLESRPTAKLLGMSHTEMFCREAHSDPRLWAAWTKLGYRK